MPKPATAPRPRGVLDRALGAIEAVGNWLPHPATLFAILSAVVVLASAIAAALDVAVVHPGTGETIRVENLLSVAGLHRLLGSLVTNFVQFAPLGTVLGGRGHWHFCRKRFHSCQVEEGAK